MRVTSPPPGETVNDGNLCVKGRFSWEFIHHPERLTQPLVRGDDGELHPTTWDHALDVVAKGLRGRRGSPRRRRSRLHLLLPVHRRGELPHAEAGPRGLWHQQLPSMRSYVTRSHGRRSGDHVRSGRDDQFHPRDPRRRAAVRHRLQHHRGTPHHRDGDEEGGRARSPPVRGGSEGHLADEHRGEAPAAQAGHGRGPAHRDGPRESSPRISSTTSTSTSTPSTSRTSSRPRGTARRSGLRASPVYPRTTSVPSPGPTPPPSTRASTTPWASPSTPTAPTTSTAWPTWC